MNIVVCIKQVPDTASKIEVVDGRVKEEGLTRVVNPYDEYAVEEALRIKEARGAGKITLITVGPEQAKEALKTALALGPDEALICKDPAFEGSDAYGVATILARALEKLDYDMVWCGWKGVDQDQGQVGIILAELLGLPHVSFVVKLELSEDGTRATAHREVEGGREVIETSLPAVFSAQKGLNEPRYASLRGIMAVRKKTIVEWDAADLGLDPAEIGSAGAKIETVEVIPPPARQAGRIIEGTPEQAARTLVRLLREEAKVV